MGAEVGDDAVEIATRALAERDGREVDRVGIPEERILDLRARGIRFPDAVIVIGDDSRGVTEDQMVDVARILDELARDGGGVLVAAHPVRVICRDVVHLAGRRFRLVPMPDGEGEEV